MRQRTALAHLALFLLLLPGPAFAIGLTPDTPSGAPAGTTVTWTLTGDLTGYEVHSLSVGPASDPSQVRTLYDYRTNGVFPWTPVDAGSYLVVGRVRNLLTGFERELTQPFDVGPRDPLALTQPVVTATEHPLVAFYSAPPCPSGARMRVRFFAPPTGRHSTTNAKPCTGTTTMNFLIAGMRAQTTYAMLFEILDSNGAVVLRGSPVTWLTGAIAATLPNITVTVPATAAASMTEGVILQAPVGVGVGAIPHAVDLTGQVVWYYDPATKGDYGIIARPGRAGTFWSTDDPVLTRWDVLGNVRKQTTVARLNEQLTALGLDRINNVHHEARPLPDRRVAVIATVEKLLTDVQGPGEVDVLGDMILVLDDDLQIVWTWNGFDHLDNTRLPTLGRTCPPGLFPGCPPVLLIEEGVANDWMHANTITYAPTDGSLLLSVRDQDWVVKINYANGAGDGSVEWLLGPEGDFALSPADPDLWFSHQHDINFATPTRIVLYDNNNERCEGVPSCVSRGQVLELDDVLGVATLVQNIELGEYAEGASSAEPLANGNAYFNSGFDGFSQPQTNRGREFQPDGTLVFEIETQTSAYRHHRLKSLYALPPGWGLPQN